MLQPEDSDSDSGDGHEQSGDDFSEAEDDVESYFASMKSTASGGSSTLERRTAGSSATVAKASVQSFTDETSLHTAALELYVLVARCIAFPFSAQAKTSMGYTRHLKLNESDLQQYCAQFEKFHKGGMPGITSDELFDKAILCYYDNFLISKRLLSLVHSGGCTFADLRKVFQNYVEKFLKNLPLMERVAHDHVLSIWMSKFEAICHGSEDMETVRRETLKTMHDRQSADDSTAPEHLYKVFQDILGIPQREHHLIAKEMQVNICTVLANEIQKKLQCNFHRVFRTACMQDCTQNMQLHAAWKQDRNYRYFFPDFIGKLCALTKSVKFPIQAESKVCVLRPLHQPSWFISLRLLSVGCGSFMG